MRLTIHTFICVLFVLPFTTVAAKSPATGWRLLEPVRDANGHARELRGPDGREVPLVRPLSDHALAARLQAVLGTGAPALLPVLDEFARAAGRSPIACPLWHGGIAIYLSDEDGGFARKGLFIGESAESPPQQCSDYFIDITVDDSSLDDGGFEEVLTHEFGHVFLRRLLGPVPPTPTRNPHSVFAITDPITAFDEGFGISLQPLAARLSTTPGFRQRLDGTAPPSPTDFWLSRRETWMRETAVPHGDFAFESRPPAAQMRGIERWRAAETAPPDDRCHLKNGDAMMASEAVAAQFLFRLLDSGGDRATLSKRYHQLATVLAQIGHWPTSQSPLIVLVRTWGNIYPQERRQVTRLFLETTHGATASAAMRIQAESLSCLGSTGAMRAFLPALKTYRHDMDRLVDDVLAGHTALDAALNPPLWLADPAPRVPAQLWDARVSQPLVANINTADETTLAWLLDDDRLGRAIVVERRKRGFASLGEVLSRVGMTSAQRMRLRQLAANYPALPPFVRQ